MPKAIETSMPRSQSNKETQTPVEIPNSGELPDYHRQAHLLAEQLAEEVSHNESEKTKKNPEVVKTASVLEKNH